jgi:hypothetical protein
MALHIASSGGTPMVSPKIIAFTCGTLMVHHAGIPTSIYSKEKKEPMMTKFVEVLQNTPHYYVIILSPTLYNRWPEMLSLYDLQKYVVHDSLEPIFNPAHAGEGRRLRLVILKGTGENDC